MSIKINKPKAKPGRKKEYSFRMTLTLTPEMIEEIDALRMCGGANEDRLTFIRLAINQEVARRKNLQMNTTGQDVSF